MRRVSIYFRLKRKTINDRLSNEFGFSIYYPLRTKRGLNKAEFCLVSPEKHQRHFKRTACPSSKAKALFLKKKKKKKPGELASFEVSSD